MAKKTPMRTEKGLTRDELHKIWGKVREDQWQDIFQKYKPANGFVPIGGGTFKGLCINPEHADTSPSCYIHTLKGFAYCFGCEFHSSNPIELLELIMETNTSEVFTFLKDQYEIQSLSKKAQAQFEQQRVNLATKDAIYSATHAALCDAVSLSANPDYAFAQKAVNWLTVDRAVPPDVLHCLPVGVMPPLARLAEIMTEQYTKKYEAWKRNPEKFTEPQNYAIQATQYFHDYSQVPFFSGSVVWPLHVTPKEIGRFKLRSPHSNTKKDFIIPDDPFENFLGLYGLGWDQYKLFTQNPNTKPDYVYLTEGEMDVMSLMARFMAIGDVKYPIFSVGGTGASGHIEPILKMSGISKAYLIGDAPIGKGDEVVREWLNKISDIETRVFSGWGRLTPHKDLDEAVVREGEAKVSDIVHNKFSETFVPAWEWACNCATQDISNIPEHDLKSVILAASVHGRYLRNRIDCDLYIKTIADKYDLNQDILKREIASREDSEDGFMLRIKDALSDFLYLVGTDNSSQGRILVLFNKNRRSYHNIKLDTPQSIFQELAPVIGPPCDFIRDHVGYPGFLPDPAISTNSLGYTSTDKLVRTYTNGAMLKWTKGSPYFSNATILNQGYHYVTDQENKNSEYLVCGADVLKIHRSDQGDTSYQMLEGPSDGSVIFNVNKQRSIPDSWYPGGLSIPKLMSAKNTNIHELYRDLTDFFDIGFRFKQQNVVPNLLASLVMLFPIMDIFPRPPLLFITGDTNSGKSTLLNVFGNVGTLNNTGLRLLFGSVKYDNYSAASAAYEAANSTLLRIYDEFETSHRNHRHAEAVNGIYELYRSLVTGIANRIRVNPDGGVSQVTLRHPIIFGAISGAETPQDMNRLTVVEMLQVKGAFFPLNLIRQRLGQPKIDQLSRITNLALYHHIPAILARYPEVVKSYEIFAPSLPIAIDSRYVSAFFSVFTLMDYLGIDWKTFFYNWIISNEDLIVRSSSIRESDSVLRDMLYANVIRQKERDNPACVAQLLASPDNREEINTAAVGMYYDQSHKLLLILIAQALPRLLYRPGMLPMTTTRLKDILDRHSAALSTKEILDSGILNKIDRFMGVGIKVQDVVVLHANQWLAREKPSKLVPEITTTATTPEQPVQNKEEVKEATNDDPSGDPQNPANHDFDAAD
jgi:hypothetical protein